MKDPDRPNMFVKELHIYLDYFKEKLNEAQENRTKKQEKYLSKFSSNLNDAVHYYLQLNQELKNKVDDLKSDLSVELNTAKNRLSELQLDIEKLFSTAAV